MAEPDKRPVTMEELLVSSLAQTDALAKTSRWEQAYHPKWCYFVLQLQI